MTIKENNWQERFDAGVHLEFGSTSPDQIKNFISTLLEEQKKDLLSELIEEIKILEKEHDLSVVPLKVKSLLKSKQQ